MSPSQRFHCVFLSIAFSLLAAGRVDTLWIACQHASMDSPYCSESIVAQSSPLWYSFYRHKFSMHLYFWSMSNVTSWYLTVASTIIFLRRFAIREHKLKNVCTISFSVFSSFLCSSSVPWLETVSSLTNHNLQQARYRKNCNSKMKNWIVCLQS